MKNTPPHILFLLLILSLSANAQTQLKKWYINSYEYDMTNVPPTSIQLSNGQTGACNGIYNFIGTKTESFKLIVE